MFNEIKCENDGNGSGASSFWRMGEIWWEKMIDHEQDELTGLMSQFSYGSTIETWKS